jgi:hypothetical protein
LLSASIVEVTVMSNLAQMTTADLDKLIAEAGRERARRTDDFPAEPPQGEVVASANPRWRGDVVERLLLLRILDRGHGWLNYTMTKSEASLLMTYMLRLLTSGHLDGDPTPVVDVSASSTRH